VVDGGAVLPNDPYTSLDQVFRDFSTVYLEIEVGTETLTPRIKVVAAAYALNADHLDGKDASEYLDTSTTPQTKSGDLDIAGALDVGGQVTIQGGTPGTGRVLTSSATGLAAWQELPAVQINQLGMLADRLGAPDPSDLPFATLSSFDCSGGNTATLSFTAGGLSLGAVTGFVGRDRISSSFEYLVAIETTGVVTPDAQIGLIGRLTIQRNALTTTFTGRITEFGLASQVGATRTYVARMEPTLSVLLRRAGYRVFQSVTMSDVIDNVLSDAGIAAYSIDLSGSYLPADMVLQYNESDLQFISRLTETEGVHYHFEEGVAEDQVIFADYNLALPVASGTYGYHGDMQNPGTGEEFIATFHSRTREFSATGTVGGYDFTSPAASILQSSPSGGGVGEIYEFDTNVEDNGRAASRALIVVQRDQVRRSEHSGTGNAAGFKAGHRFTLTDHTTAGFGGSYVVTAINHFAVSDDPLCINYGNTFTAIPDSVTFRPERVTPRPVVKGPMTAVVTGPLGEEIFTDIYGRVKVQFHWDRAGMMDENSSGWIRVATPVGREDDRRYIPRIGSEVLVDFLQGDPDRPIVLGKTYNGDNPPTADEAKLEGNSVSLNVDGPDGDQFLYFFDGAGAMDESLSWNDAADRFDLTNDLKVNGAMESVGSLLVGSSLTVGGSIVGSTELTVGGQIMGDSLSISGPIAGGIVFATDTVQGDTVLGDALVSAGPITAGTMLTLPGPITLNGADISQSGGTFSFAGGVSASGNLSSTGDLTVGGGDILAGTLNIAPTSTLSLSGSLVTMSGIESRMSSNSVVRTMIDADNNTTTSMAGWFRNGSYINANKIADLQESGNLRVRGSLTPFVSFDIAESFRASEPVEPGDLVRLDPASAGAIRLTAGAADPLVIGVVSDGVTRSAPSTRGTARGCAMSSWPRMMICAAGLKRSDRPRKTRRNAPPALRKNCAERKAPPALPRSRAERIAPEISRSGIFSRSASRPGASRDSTRRNSLRWRWPAGCRSRWTLHSARSIRETP
jgi:type VI secretion system VgrG family protein